MSGHLHADDTEPASAESKEQTRFAKRTRQRRAVTGALAEQPGFVSAQALHAQLQAAGHQVGLSTVYRTLHALAEAGSVDTVRGEGGEELFRRRRTPGHAPPPPRPPRRAGGGAGAGAPAPPPPRPPPPPPPPPGWAARRGGGAGGDPARHCADADTKGCC